MATWNDLIDNVSGELNRDDFQAKAPAGASVGVSQRALNRTLQNMFGKHPFSWRVVATPLPVLLTVNTTLYDLSTIPGGVKFQDIFGVWLDTGDTQSRFLDEKSLQWFVDNWANVDFVAAGLPALYTRLDKYSIRIAPKPNAADTLRVYYTLEHTDITDFTVAITVPDKAQEVLELGMLARLYRHLHEWETATGHYNLYNQELDKLVQEDKDKPDLEFVMQPVQFGVRAPSIDYWKSPFYR